MAERVIVQSSDLAAVTYNEQTRTLTVEFHRGKCVFEYYQVEQDVYERLLAAPSVGSFFRRAIRDFYEFKDLSTNGRQEYNDGY